jgi:hypothetical protein
MSIDTSQLFQLVVDKVNKWAREHAPTDYNYGSRQSYWALALQEKIINELDYQYAAAWYGNLWTYRGD